MHAHLVQLDIQWESPLANYERVQSLIDSAPIKPGDLIALPELFDSGFSLNTHLTNDTDNQTLAFLAQLAKDTGCLIHGSRTTRQPNHSLALNCATVLGPDSSDPICEYHKIHPFSMGNELKAYQAGNQTDNQLAHYTWNDLKVCPTICYDLRFPELFRKGFIDGAQMFVLGANWPTARQHHWRALLIARAIENQAFVLGINRTGNDPHLPYAGGTIAVDPKGEILGELGDQEAVLSVEIDPVQVQQWRTQFPVINDIKIRSF